MVIFVLIHRKNRYMLPKTSLEQWAAFIAVVEEGSFSRAAESLNKSQSSVSYAVAKLQDRMPTPLLTLEGRKAELTELGKTLYRHAKMVMAQAVQLDKTAEDFARGWESEVTLAVDAVVCLRQVFCALQAFSNDHPSTRLRILETTLSGTEEALLTRQADIVILPRTPPGFLGTYWGDVFMLPVAHRTHPLVSQNNIDEETLKSHRQLVIRDTGIKREQDGGWLGSDQRWTVSHFSSSIEAIKAGLGFGFVPKAMIEQEIQQGDLVPLKLMAGAIRKLPLYLVLSNQSHAGPAAQAIADFILQKKKMKERYNMPSFHRYHTRYQIVSVIV